LFFGHVRPTGTDLRFQPAIFAVTVACGAAQAVGAEPPTQGDRRFLVA
jgi:hypothetical protein